MDPQPQGLSSDDDHGVSRRQSQQLRSGPDRVSQPPPSTDSDSRHPKPSASSPEGEALPSSGPNESFPNSTSLRDIRKTVLSKTSLPTGSNSLSVEPEAFPSFSSASPSVDTALAALNGSRRASHGGPSAAALMQPRSAGGRRVGKSESEDDDDGDEGRRRRNAVDHDGIEDLQDEDEMGEGARKRRAANSRRMTMLDFLASAPPDEALPGPSRLTIPSSMSSPLSSSLPRQVVSRSGSARSAGHSPRRRPLSLAAQSPTRRVARTESEESDGKDIGMTMLDFLGSPRPENAQSLAARARAEEDVRKARQKREHEQLKVVVTPMTDTLTMFGSTQTSANYSLSGTVSVSLPRPQKQAMPTRQDRSRAPSPNFPAEGQADGWLDSRVPGGTLRPSLETSALSPPMTVKSLVLTFAGHSIYADSSGRYSGLKLCEVKQDLLADGASLPLSADLHTGETSGALNASEPLKYEIQFDVNVPGWLPGSACSRFGATFYSVSATAVVFDDEAGERSVTSGSSVDAPRCASPETMLRGPIALDIPSSSAANSGPDTPSRRPSFSAENVTASAAPRRGDEAGPSSAPPTLPPEISAFGQSSSASRVPTVKQKAKGGSWLSKRAKQLSLKARASSPAEETDSKRPLSGSKPIERPPPKKVRVHRPDRPGRGRLSDGSLLVRSNKQLIIIRRCRDVVPVPVARLAIVGDNLPEGAQDQPAQVLRPSTGDQPRSDSGTQAASTDNEDEAPQSQAVMRGNAHHAQQHSSGETAASARAVAADTTPEGSVRGSSTTGAPGPNCQSARESAETDATSSAADVAAHATAEAQSESTETSRVDRPTDSDTVSAEPPVPQLAPTTSPVIPASGLHQQSRAGPELLPVAPSAFNAPTDPAKLNAISRLPAAPVRTSSAVPHGIEGSQGGSGAAAGESAGAGRPHGRGGPPMRHFLHRPILHPPADSGIDDPDGLPFSLTISVPSHVQVQTANVLTFGVQVEVERTSGWAKVRELGGLRLRDMELICLQTERLTSIPSRTFCATFPVPPEPKIASKDLPVLPDFTPPLNNRPLQSSQEVRVRSAYDQQAVLTNIHLVETGRQLPPEGNSIERIKTVAVGPPPTFQREQQSEQQQSASTKGKEKDRDRGRVPDSAGAAAGPSRTAGPPRTGPVTEGSDHPIGGLVAPAAASGGRVVASVGHRPGTAPQGGVSHGHSATSDAGSSAASAANPRSQPARAEPDVNGRANNLLPPLPITNIRSRSAHSPARHEHSEATASRNSPSLPAAAQESSVGANSTSPSPITPRRAGRGRRAYEATMRGLSAFATAMMDGGYDEGNGNEQQGSSESTQERDQPRAAYSFAGDDGHGVDLTKGRIRMTVNLPLVSSSATMARRDHTPQLVSDYESPHMRIRHKLKIKLGFGFGAKPLGGEGDWGQALVMAVPVRFSEAPPKEVREQFAPLPITVTSAGPNGASTIQPQVTMTDPSTAPVLPAYTQLFRDDGSRLNEAEDLPAYPGPRKVPSLASMPSRPRLHNRGSVTGRMTPRLDNSGSRMGNQGHDGSTPSSPAIPMLNSVAPEQILDDAIQGLTDPDESMAAIREQERELQELQEGHDDLGIDVQGEFDQDALRAGALGGSTLEIENNSDDAETGQGGRRGDEAVVVGNGSGEDGHEGRIRAMEEELGI